MAKVKDYWKLSRRFSTPLTGTVVARCGSTGTRASQLCVYLVDIHTAPYRRAQLVAHQTPSMDKKKRYITFSFPSSYPFVEGEERRKKNEKRRNFEENLHKSQCRFRLHAGSSLTHTETSRTRAKDRVYADGSSSYGYMLISFEVNLLTLLLAVRLNNHHPLFGEIPFQLFLSFAITKRGKFRVFIRVCIDNSKSLVRSEL